jgi:hypothetical protein
MMFTAQLIWSATPFNTAGINTTSRVRTQKIMRRQHKNRFENDVIVDNRYIQVRTLNLPLATDNISEITTDKPCPVPIRAAASNFLKIF